MPSVSLMMEIKKIFCHFENIININTQYNNTHNRLKTVVDGYLITMTRQP